MVTGTGFSAFGLLQHRRNRSRSKVESAPGYRRQFRGRHIEFRRLCPHRIAPGIIVGSPNR
jgi:hypothetical protein